MGIFKAYDIRGTVPDELDADIAYRIGRATAGHLGGLAFAVGRDARRSSPELAEALVAGIRDEGVDVIDVGLVTTPMLYFAVEHLGVDGGVMVTASHNPAQYNGFKVCREHAIPVGSESGLRDIEALVRGGGETAAAMPAGARRGAVSHADIRTAYVEHLRTHFPEVGERRVVVDCGNGMAAVGLGPLLDDLPLEVDRLFWEPDGTFPNHEADPLKPENLAWLIDRVRETGADLGVAFDGDADRAAFVDERGVIVTSDLTTALLARRALERTPGGRVVYDLRSSRATREEIEAAGGIAEMSRVGHSFIKASMRAGEAVFGGELSGHFYFRFGPTLYTDDGIAALLAMLELLDREGRPLSALVQPLDRYSRSGEISLHVDDPAALIAAVEREHQGAEEISHLDGLLVRYPDWWFNLRPSNTEPVVRLNLEADSLERMAQERDRLVERLQAAAIG